MTSEKINSFVGDLVAMARAMERQPELEHEIATLQRSLNESQAARAALEGSNDILRNHIDDLNAKIAEVTKERDDAGFRCLEADDRAAVALDLARTLQVGLGQVIAKLEPKPEPVVELPNPIVSDGGVGREPEQTKPVDYFWEDTTKQYHPPQVDDPRLPETAPIDHAKAELDRPSDANWQSQDRGANGQFGSKSEARPTQESSASGVATTGSDTSGHVESVSPQEAASQDKPYAGKRYRDVPGYISRQDWLDGGGTIDDYYTL